MSCGCMYILRDVRDVKRLRDKLIYNAKEQGYGLCFEPVNNLLLEHMVDLGMSDFAFEVCDSFKSNDASLLLSYEGWTVNGVRANLPLLERLRIIEDVAVSCVPYTETIEIYLGEDTPRLQDYLDYRIATTDIADTLLKEYQSDSYKPFIPCVHLVVKNSHEASMRQG